MAEQEYKMISVKPETHYMFRRLAAELNSSNDDTLQALMYIYNRYQAQSRVPYFVAPGTSKDKAGLEE